MRQGYKLIWEENYENIPEEFVSVIQRKEQKFVQIQGNSSPNNLSDIVIPVSEKDAKELIEGGEINWLTENNVEIISKEEIEKEKEQIEQDGRDNEEYLESLKTGGLK